MKYRYFLISYIGKSNDNGAPVYGDTTTSCLTYPSRTKIVDYLRKDANLSTITILAISEFATEDDFNNFRQTE